MLLTADTVVTGHEVLEDGWVEVVGDRVLALGAGRPPRPADVELGGTTILPGFVDMHTHGGGGGSFPEATDAAVEAALELHGRHGTTTMIASLVSAHPAELLRQVEVLADHVEAGSLAGIHLEGPWLSPRRCGAHDPTALRAPDAAEVAAVLAAGRGTIRMVTIAPELDGAMAAIAQFVDAGVVAAVGHTDADYAQVVASIDAGASVATHLFNAMRPIHHREPGPVVALVEDPRVTVELITDGVHLHPALYREVTRRVGPDRVALVTDAMAAAGMADGAYRLGELDVQVSGGVATVAGTETIAGSTATMAGNVRFAVTESGRPRTEALLAVSRQASITPALAMGLPADGLVPGAAADLVVLDDDLAVAGVLRRGAWVVDPA